MAENIMRDGISIIDTCKELEQRGADVVGMNCFRGPSTMLPDIKKIRDSVKCHVAALPICYRTTEKQPTFFNLEDHNNCDCPAPHGRAFPTALDPLYCNRYEIRKFIEEVYSIGVNYLGLCCGASPMLIREVANAIGSSMAQISGYSEKVFSTTDLSRDEIIEISKNEAIENAVKKGAEKKSVEIIDLEEIPLSYLPSNAITIKTRAVGNIKNKFNYISDMEKFSCEEIKRRN